MGGSCETDHPLAIYVDGHHLRAVNEEETVESDYQPGKNRWLYKKSLSHTKRPRWTGTLS